MQTLYMNTATGSVDTYEGWEYETDDGETVNAVDLGEVVELTEDEITEEYQDWKGERTVLELINGTDVCLQGSMLTSHRTADRWYRLWFNEGWDTSRLFGVDDIDDTAERFGFDPARVNPGCDIALCDDDGDQIGGVVFDGWSR